ncbi:hypothetical protein pb186bvf_004306 [Paramecium bursaria]
MFIILLQIVQAHYFLNSSVIELDSFQLDDAFNSSKSWFILFYRPSCPHCLQVIPTWKSFASQYQGSLSQIGSVNCDEHPDVIKKVELHGAPTFMLYNSQQQTRYFEGNKTQQEFYEFMSQNYDILQVVNENQMPEPLDKFLKIGIPVISGFLIFIVVCICRYRKKVSSQITSKVQVVEVKQQIDEQQL